MGDGGLARDGINAACCSGQSADASEMQMQLSTLVEMMMLKGDWVVMMAKLGGERARGRRTTQLVASFFLPG